MPRPKGSSGIYYRWPPEKIAELYWDAQLVFEEIEDTTKQRPNKLLAAKWLKQKFPTKYRYVTEEQLRQLLSKAYNRNRTVDDLNAFNEATWKYMLGETDHSAKSAGQDFQQAHAADDRGAVEAARGDGNDAALEDIEGDVDTVGMDNQLAAAADEDILGAPAGKDFQQTARQDRRAESSAAQQYSGRDAADDRAAVERSSPAPERSRGTS